MVALPPRPTRLVLLALFVALAGLAVGPTTLIASDLTTDGTVAAQSSDDVIHVDETIEHDPHPAGNVSVTIHVPAAEVVDGAEIRPYYPGWNVSATETTNFEKTGDTEWTMRDSGADAVLTYRLELAANGDFQHSGEGWASFDFYEDSSTWADRSYDYEYNRTFASNTFRDPRNDWTVIGDFETNVTTLGDGATITLVRASGAEIRTNLSYVGQQLAEVTARRDVRTVNTSVVGLAVPQEDAAGYAEDNRFVVGAPAGFEGNASVWFHEYFHTLDPVDTYSNMTWYSEAYASWGDLLSMVQQGHTEFSDFQGVLDRGRNRNESLAEQENSTAGINYVRGPLVLLAIDRQIRAASGGTNDLDDVINGTEEVHSVSLEEFVQIIADVSNQTVADRAETWIRTTQGPSPWSLEAHQSAFGPAQEFTVARSNVSRYAGGRNRSVSLGDDPTFYPNQAVRFDYTVRNEGDLRGSTSVESVVESFSGDVSTYESTVTVSGTSNQTVSHVHRFASTDTYYVAPAAASGALVDVADVVAVNGTVPTDPDADGRYEDFDGDGTIEEEDAERFFQHRNEQAVTDHVPAYDMNANGKIDLADTNEVYDEAQS